MNGFFSNFLSRQSGIIIYDQSVSKNIIDGLYIQNHSRRLFINLTPKKEISYSRYSWNFKMVFAFKNNSEPNTSSVSKLSHVKIESCFKKSSLFKTSFF